MSYVMLYICIKYAVKLMRSDTYVIWYSLWVKNDAAFFTCGLVDLTAEEPEPEVYPCVSAEMWKHSSVNLFDR